MLTKEKKNGGDSGYEMEKVIKLVRWYCKLSVFYKYLIKFYELKILF